MITTDSAADGATEAQVAAALARCAAGERAALRVIYDIEAGRMVGVARRMLRRQDLAEEAVQDAFMRVWRSARTFDLAKGAARSWLYAILRNCALTILRDESRFTADESLAEEAVPATESALTRLPEHSALRRCLERLDASRRAAVVLAYVHGLSHGELAGKLGVPLGTAKSWVRRSLISLQECMG
ncbi:sigma-70 family RNA polymerase sigma factor [Rhodoplanes sp. Z2-YC6860]|uniref:sigma-70 family RNA polymerase sigma factor n=1 Tax=Rhodoplanes sp. Z2-YC6860 TaxID=674703 RepID=UPI00078D6EF6|nr:sigma-70 family RNA polymerase sigma factor [Rhodoplanes sp. Z2-YC6860]AMN40104.1 sigma-70 family RNA polymerase sigma factor [Rhodoplanes sp. Z2-YC6860]